jgi:hypothetical protein
MKLILKNRITRDDDLISCYLRKKKIEEIFLLLLSIVAALIMIFVFYAYFIDKS